MEIRNCKEEDIDEVMGLVRLCKPLVLHNDFTYWILFKYFGDTCFVIAGDDKIVGYVSGVTSTAQKGVLYLWQIAIAPDYRGKNYAKFLIEKMLNVARKKKCKSLQFSVSPKNEASFSLFSRFAGKHRL